jgi:uncharacterized protein
MDDGPEPAKPPVFAARRPLLVALIVTAVVTLLSWRLPARHAATGVGLGFLAATWWLVLRRDEEDVRHFGLSMGGLFERTRLDPRRLVRDAAVALGWALLFAVIIYPPFLVGYRLYHHTKLPFRFVLPPRFWDDVAGQLVVIALPEEAFFRGYLQTALDDAWRPRLRVLGAMVGPGVLVASLIFAVGHVLTDPKPARLAVFFPSLLFGWLRARTGGIGAGLAFHAMCNLLVSLLQHGFGLVR